MRRINCCQPTGYDGLSQTIVHGPTCVTPDIPLTSEEMAVWRQHPSVTEPPAPIRYVPPTHGEWYEVVEP